MLKIAIDCRMYASSGIGVYLRGILPYILKSENFFLLIGDYKELKAFSKLRNVEIIQNKIKPFSIQETYFFPAKEINKCDLYYNPYINTSKKIKIPIYVTIHDLLFLDIPNITSKFGYLIRKKYYKKIYKAAEKIFTVSNFSKKRIEHHFGNKKEIMVTYNGISEYILEDIDKKNEKKNYIIFVGNIKKHKGLKKLLLAYKSLRDKGFKEELIIVGERKNFKTNDKEIIRIIEAEDIKGLKFMGHISDKELKKLLSEAKYLIQPSEYEGFGIPPLEALSLGTQVIISDIEVFREIYDEKEFFFFKTQEELEKILLSKKEKEIDIEKIKVKYSYKQAAHIIMETFGKAKKVGKNE